MELTGLEKHKNKILNVIIILVVLIVSRNIYRYQFNVKLSLGKKDAVEIKKNKVLENISQLEKRINSYKNLLVKKDPSLIINSISNIAKESGIKIASIKPNPEQAYPEYIKFPFNLALIAPSYHALGKFISRIESLKDVYSIDSLEMKPDIEAKELNVNLAMSSIVFRD